MEKTKNPIIKRHRFENKKSPPADVATRAADRQMTAPQPPRVFGAPLRALETINLVPYPVFEMLAAATRSWDAVRAEGVFRVSGDAVEMAALVRAYDAGLRVDLMAARPATVTGLLKTLLRRVPGHLVPADHVAPPP